MYNVFHSVTSFLSVCTALNKEEKSEEKKMCLKRAIRLFYMSFTLIRSEMT